MKSKNNQTICRYLQLRCLSCLFLLVAVAVPVPAQEISAGLNLLLGVPLGEFSDNVENAGFGLGGHLAFQLGQSPLHAGFDLGLMIYGSETRREPFSTTIPDVTVEVETTNNLAFGHFLLRMQAPRGVFRPYIDGVLGIHYLFTETEIRDEDDPAEEPIASSTNQEDVAFSYGTGAGLMLRVYEKKASTHEKSSRSLKSVLLDFRVRHLFGSESDYLKRGSIRREGGRVIYDLQHSRTDVLTFQLGTLFSF